jgi:hypothetical protein
MPQRQEGEYRLAFLRGRENRKLSMCRRTVIVLLSIGATIATGIFTGCSHTGHSDLDKGQSMSGKTIEQVQDEHTDEWMAIAGVEGTAIGLFKGKPCIKILISSRTEQIRTKIPSKVEGYPIIVEETGQFRALDQQ